MNWKLRFNSIQHAETYQGRGACEVPAGLRLSCWLKAGADCTRGFAWPPEADGVIFWLSPRIGETQAFISWNMNEGTGFVKSRWGGLR